MHASLLQLSARHLSPISSFMGLDHADSFHKIEKSFYVSASICAQKYKYQWRQKGLQRVYPT
jgi:hypothetical protein